MSAPPVARSIVPRPSSRTWTLRRAAALLTVGALSATSFVVSVASAPQAEAASAPQPIVDLEHRQQLPQPFEFDPHTLWGGRGNNYFTYPMSEPGPAGVVSGARNRPEVTVLAPRVGTEVMSTLAVDGGGLEGERAARMYAWTWGTGGTSGRPPGSPTPASAFVGVAAYDEGEVAGRMHFVPMPSQLSGASVAYNYWSGGEVFQETGELYLGSGECAGINRSFRLGIYDPSTGTARGSGRLVPTTPGDNVFGAGDSCGGNGYVASDMAIDASGNAFLLVKRSQSDWRLVRVVPGEHQQEWRYSLVGQVRSATGGAHSENLVYGMAFLNGQLYYQGTVGPRLWRIDPTSLRAQASFIDSPMGQDLAASQTAPVLEGVVFHDVTGDGQVEGASGLPGQTVGLYDADGVLLGLRETDGSGRYSFILNGVGRDFHVRVVQPQIDGINAVQTYGGGGSTGSQNTVTAHCADGGGVPSGSACAGHVPMPAPDPSVGDVGAATDLSTVPILTTVHVASANEVTSADFGVYAPETGSWGDAPFTSTREQDGPRLYDFVTAGDPLRLGDERGEYVDGANDNSHTTTGGVVVAGSDGPIELGGDTILSAGSSYDLVADLQGEGADEAHLSAWLARADDPQDFTTGSTHATGEPGTAREHYPYAGEHAALVGLEVPAAGAGALKQTWLRVVASGSDFGTPDNRTGAYQPQRGSAEAATLPWAGHHRGEIEDYRVHVADAVVRIAATTLDGVADDDFGYTLSGPISGTAPSATTSSFRPTSPDSVTYGPTSHAVTVLGEDVTVAAAAPPGLWRPVSARVVDTRTGEAIADAGVELQGTQGQVVIPGPALERGRDVTVEFTYAVVELVPLHLQVVPRVTLVPELLVGLRADD